MFGISYLWKIWSYQMRLFSNLLQVKSLFHTLFLNQMTPKPILSRRNSWFCSYEQNSSPMLLYVISYWHWNIKVDDNTQNNLSSKAPWDILKLKIILFASFLIQNITLSQICATYNGTLMELDEWIGKKNNKSQLPSTH